ncbi:MAG: CopD family protein [Anaerolineaceae bacterium]
MKRTLLGGLLSLLAVGSLMSPADASGHAALVRSEPASNAFLQKAPTSISLQFSEPIDERASGIRLLDARGLELKGPGAVEVSGNGLTLTLKLPALLPDIYNVLYKNVSRIDGHALQGSYPFTVLKADGSLPVSVNQVRGISSDPDPAPLADGIAVRALSLLGLAIVAAGALLILLWGSDGAALRRPLGLAIYGGTGILAVATLLNLATIRDAYGGSISVSDLVLHTPSGGYWLTRLGVVMLLAVAATFVRDAPRRTAVCVVAGFAVYLWAYTATSHGAAGAGSGWGRAFDFAHAMSAVVWIGAVLGVVLSARMAGRSGAYRRLMPRFGLLASIMVFVLLASGTLSAFVEIDATERLLSTRYGLTLLVKLGLIAPLLAVAAYNARWGRARLEAGGGGEPRRFIRTASVEVFLGLGVFLAASLLTQTSVAKSVTENAEPKPFEQVYELSDLNVRLNVDPNATGLNKYRVALTDKSAQPVDAERVRLTFRYQDDQTVGPSTLILAKIDSGVYLGQGPYLTLEGQWRVEAEVRRASTDDATAFFAVRPSGGGVADVSRGGAWGNPAPGLSWNQLGGIVLLIVGLGFALGRNQLSLLNQRLGWTANGMTMLGFGFGTLLLFGVHGHEAPPGGFQANPVFADQNSISAGRALYSQNCATCHGQTGVPPGGLKLDPYPLDLTVHVPQHPDGQLYNFITKGIVGTAMRSWTTGDGKLTAEQVWHLVNYLRTLRTVSR